jgi:nucleotide-binding universal stress UspA family protein
MQTILVALDGSTRADKVLRSAIDTARTQGARLALLRSISLPPEVPQTFWQSTDLSLLDVLEKAAHEYLARCESLVPEGTRGGTHVVIGSPWQSICRTAETLGASLVVLGSHGYSGVDHLLGTTAAKVVNHCGCSVLVVKDRP